MEKQPDLVKDESGTHPEQRAQPGLVPIATRQYRAAARKEGKTDPRDEVVYPEFVAAGGVIRATRPAAQPRRVTITFAAVADRSRYGYGDRERAQHSEAGSLGG
ncbi:MAG: hypothetical protein H0T69_09135 [Thermoleophilaceae bacterium]|nr:hypothetical protein [Thermoleophilaceae bacterium]